MTFFVRLTKPDAGDLRKGLRPGDVLEVEPAGYDEGKVVIVERCRDGFAPNRALYHEQYERTPSGPRPGLGEER